MTMIIMIIMTMIIINKTKKRLKTNSSTAANLFQNAKKCETAEAELSKVEFKVNSCVEELAKMDQFAKVIITVITIIVILATVIIFTSIMITRWQKCESWKRRWQRSRDHQRQRR